jgi:hypothetical protein
MKTAKPWELGLSVPTMTFIVCGRQTVAKCDGMGHREKAKRIIRAVNAHADLVEACRAALDSFDEAAEVETPTMALCRAALRKAP